MEENGREKPKRAKGRRISRELALAIVILVVLGALGLSYKKLSRAVPLMPEIISLEYELFRDPESGGHEWLGRLYGSAGMYGMALYHLSKADTAQNTSFDLKISIAEMYLVDRKYQKAKDKYEEALQLAQDDISKKMCWQNISGCYLALGDYDKAIEAANELLKLWPDDSYGLAQLGNIYNEKGDYDKAIQYYKESIENYEYESVCYRLAEVYRKQAEYAKAIEFYEKSLRIHDEKVAEIGSEFYTGLPSRKAIEKRIAELKALKSGD